jgi:hypothetical protein
VVMSLYCFKLVDDTRQSECRWACLLALASLPGFWKASPLGQQPSRKNRQRQRMSVHQQQHQQQQQCHHQQMRQPLKEQQQHQGRLTLVSLQW